jgi:hypothetical protein
LLGEVRDPESYLASPQNAEGLPSSQKEYFVSRVAKVAGRPASSGAKRIPFLIMCGTEDPRFEMAKEFATILKSLGYLVDTAWPRTPHWDNAKHGKIRDEFKKYSQVVTEFFLRATNASMK